MAVRALAAVAHALALPRQRGTLPPLLSHTELRSVGADDYWLSPAYRRPSLAITLTWGVDEATVRSEALPIVEAALAPYRPRPHWGTLFGISPAQLAAAYPMMSAYRTLLRQLDPAAKFRNAFVQRHVFGMGAPEEGGADDSAPLPSYGPRHPYREPAGCRPYDLVKGMDHGVWHVHGAPYAGIAHRALDTCGHPSGRPHPTTLESVGAGHLDEDGVLRSGEPLSSWVDGMVAAETLRQRQRDEESHRKVRSTVDDDAEAAARTARLAAADQLRAEGRAANRAKREAWLEGMHTRARASTTKYQLISKSCMRRFDELVAQHDDEAADAQRIIEEMMALPQ
jgi:hypothetical protein